MPAIAIDEPARHARELDDLTLARAKAGEGAAFRTLVETYQRPVFALLWRFLGTAAHPSLVDDLAQETFLGVYRGLARFDPRGPARLSTWILTIATRTALKERRRASSRLVASEELDDQLASPSRTEQPAENRAFLARLAHALAALPEPFRVVFLLREYHDFEYQDIAAALDVDLGTVKSRLSRARKQLQAALKEFAP